MSVTTTGTTSQIQLKISGPNITNRMNGNNSANPVTIVLYMTALNGQTLFRLQDDDVNTSGFALFTINSAPSSTSTAQQLYTIPGLVGQPLPRRAPPSLSCLLQHNDNMCGVGPDGFTIYFSSEHVQGEGFWWNPLLFALVEDTSPVIALASMDGHLIAFTRASVWIIDGQGFTENGQGGYQPAYRLASDCGCIEPRSVLTAPAGTYFQSDYGLCLLTRDLQIQFLGAAIQKTLATYPVITSATIERTRHLAIFSLATSESGGNGATGPGRFLALDYTDGQWVTWDVTDNLGTAHACAETIWMQLIAGVTSLCFVTPAGYVHTPSNDFLDTGQWVTQQIETAWIKTGGMQGFQRIWRVLALYAIQTPHDVTIEFAFDYVIHTSKVRRLLRRNFCHSRRPNSSITWQPKNAAHSK